MSLDGLYENRRFQVGNKDGKAIVKKYAVVNSDAGVESVVGQGITARRDVLLTRLLSCGVGAVTSWSISNCTCCSTFTPGRGIKNS